MACIFISGYGHCAPDLEFDIIVFGFEPSFLYGLVFPPGSGLIVGLLMRFHLIPVVIGFCDTQDIVVIGHFVLKPVVFCFFSVFNWESIHIKCCNAYVILIFCFYWCSESFIKEVICFIVFFRLLCVS